MAPKSNSSRTRVSWYSRFDWRRCASLGTLRAVLSVCALTTRSVFPLVLAAHEHFVAGKAGDFSDLAVEIAFFRREVIPDKHHLRALLELQRFFRWIGRFGKVAHDFGFERPQTFGKGFQSLGVQV